MVTIDTELRGALIGTAHEMADAAREAILPHFRSQTLTTDNKAESGFDPVTVADRAAERAMRDVLQRRRPQDGIVGEEYGNSEGDSGLTWVLDPIDGTRGFIAGTPTWGVLIAVGPESGPVLGVIDQPYIRERFIGGLGTAEVAGPSGQLQLATRQCGQLSEAVIFTTFPEVGSNGERDAFHGVAQNCKLTRYGMDCYAYALLAAGQIDLVIEARLQSYDIQAPIAVIEAAGGVVTDWRGNPVHNGGNVIAAGDRDLHAVALKLLGG